MPDILHLYVVEINRTSLLSICVLKVDLKLPHKSIIMGKCFRIIYACFDALPTFCNKTQPDILK